MKSRIFFGLILALAPIHFASAQVFPRHEDICDARGFVIKRELAKAFLDVQEDWRKLYLASVEAPGPSHRRPVWQRIFTDPNFCVNNPACLKLNTDANPPRRDTSAALKTLTDLRLAFAGALLDLSRGRSYRIDNPSIGTEYFVNERAQIECLPYEPPLASKPAPGIKLPVRLRANSDDLNIDQETQKDAFKGLKPASITYTRDGVGQKTSTTKLQAAIGYPIVLDPFALPLVRPQGLSYFTGSLIPYLSANQSISQVDGKARTLAETNNVAAGMLLNTQSVFDQMPGVNHVLMAKPQYLWNTKDRSEIASLKIIYQPWTDGRPPSLNTPFPLTTVDGTWIQLLFDLRHDAGDYTDKGIDPTKIAQHTSFERTGSKFGIVISTPALGPHLTLNATETLLHGFSGSVRTLSLFETTLSYYLDATDNFAFTISYTDGRNEDTAEQAQTFTVGFAAKY